ncbi:MAG: hypothetical protein Q9226_006469 [Calogaya cf. arnoldii]
MPDQNKNLKKCLDKLEQFVRDLQVIFPYPEELEQLVAKFQGIIPNADEWDAADGDLEKFKRLALLLHERGTTTNYIGRQIADRVKAIIQDMENIDRSDADGEECNEIIEEQKTRSSAKERQTLKSSSANDKEVGASKSAGFSKHDAAHLTPFPLPIHTILTTNRTYTATSSPPFQLHFNPKRNHYYAIDALLGFGDGEIHIAFAKTIAAVTWTPGSLVVRFRPKEHDLAAGKFCELVMERVEDVKVLVRHMQGLGMEVVELGGK